MEEEVEEEEVEEKEEEEEKDEEEGGGAGENGGRGRGPLQNQESSAMLKFTLPLNFLFIVTHNGSFPLWELPGWKTTV